MTKEQRIKLFKRNHTKLKKVISDLTKEQMVQAKVLGDWTVKDIMAHISAWNWRAIEEIDSVLNNDTAWIKLAAEREDEFNKKEIEKREDKSIEEILNEWEKSFQSLMRKIQDLTEEEWNYQGGEDIWKDGSLLTVKSLFDYQYEGDGHEGGHANQIRDFFRKLR